MTENDRLEGATQRIVKLVVVALVLLTFSLTEPVRTLDSLYRHWTGKEQRESEKEVQTPTTSSIVGEDEV